ncbi:hypothetical protein [Roseiflexus castenholzii]|uniref:hypothetical protein n=1 Tax=Roseiflexus castenholzii TaxID=120962 RepID=UPI003C7B3E15
MIRRLLILALVSLGASSLYLPGFTNALLADDWAVIQRNLDLSLRDLPHLLTATHGGWYRPVFDLFIAACARIFGFEAMGYHVVALVLYVAVTTLVADIISTMTQRIDIGMLAAILFSVHGAHAEPILWVSASNELLAGLFVLLSLRIYLAFRTAPAPGRYYALTVVCYVLAIGAKETAIFLPVALAVYDLLDATAETWRERLRRLTPVAPLLAIQGLFVAFRLSTGSPYPVEIDPVRIAINLGYYLAVGLFALPDNYGYLTSLPLWRDQPVLPFVAVTGATGALGMLGWLGWQARRRIPRHQARILLFAAAWSVIALHPVLLTATGRTAFMATIGIAWMIAVGWSAVWQVAEERRALCVTALILLIGTHAGVASYRAYWWRQAGHEMERALAWMDSTLTDVPSGAIVCVTGLPDHLHHAYVFRNAFPTLNRVRFPDHMVHAFLDADRHLAQTAEVCKSAYIIHYIDAPLPAAARSARFCYALDHVIPMTIEDAAFWSCRAQRRVMPRAARNLRGSRTTPRAARGDHAGWSQVIGITLSNSSLCRLVVSAPRHAHAQLPAMRLSASDRRRSSERNSALIAGNIFEPMGASPLCGFSCRVPSVHVVA